MNRTVSIWCLLTLLLCCLTTHAQWSTPVRLQGPINSDPSPKSWPSINGTEDTIYYAKIGANGQENICYSYRFSDSLWSAPIFMPAWINSPDQRDISPSIGPGDSVLYWVTYERPGGYGSYDIWFTRRGPDGQWGQPENAGPNVNTANMEWGVFLSRNAQHLYFSSTRPGGYGFLDIWKSEWNGTGWGPATNMGLPINTYLGDEENVTLAADESCLVETAAIYSATLRDLYIFYASDSTWSQREAIPEFTSPENESGASLTPNGRIIYFSSARNDTNNYRDDLFVSHRTDTLGLRRPFILHPSSFILSAFPNPFNSTTTLSFTLPIAGNVELIVYDLLGREVKTLVNETRAPGEYRVMLDAGDWPSGIYLARLQTARGTRTSKLLLLK